MNIKGSWSMFYDSWRSTTSKYCRKMNQFQSIVGISVWEIEAPNRFREVLIVGQLKVFKICWNMKTSSHEV